GSDNNNTSELRLDDMKYIIKICDQELTYEQVVLNKNKILANWFTTPTNAEKVINDKQKFLKKYKKKRFWCLLIFYCYGPGKTEKTGWFLELFHDIKYHNRENSIEEIKEKSKKINIGIEGEEIIIGDNIYWKVYIESIKCLERIIKEKDIIIQDTVNQYEKISENTVRQYEDRLNFYAIFFRQSFNCANEYYYMNFCSYDEVVNEFINNESFIFQTDVLNVISDINNSVNNDSNRFSEYDSNDSSYN
ncbi:28601_t:CDS:2, partial [Racocetra persica]